MAERKQQIEDIFHAALAREPRERKSFLSEACSSDPSLRAEVESLISASEEPGSFLDTPAYKLADGRIDPAESLIGRSIGRYEIISLIGQGAMGDVYLARDRRLDRNVALKLLPLAFTANEIRLRRFVLEARAASSLNHPNIITIHEVGQDGAVHFIATEFVEGSTLRKCFSRGRPAISEALDIAIQVASALAAAHAAGIVHRDIKPENIMLRPDGYVKVLDFGIAKLTERRRQAVDTSASTVGKIDTDPGTVMGTTNYMSPEQTRGLSVDARSDIFSLGVVLYEMLTGRLPFAGNTQADVIASILKTEPLPLNEVAHEVAPQVQAITDKALRKAAADRYQTCDEILAELKRVRAELDFQTTRPTQPLSPGDIPVAPEAEPANLIRRRAAAALAAVLALFGLAIWLWPKIVRQNPSNPFASLQFNELQTWKSERGEGVLDARFSHGGDKIAFTLKDGWQRIWVKTATPDARPTLITQDESNNWWPIWSSDDQEIAFVSSRSGETGIWSVSAHGGEARLLKKVTETSVRPRHWSKDGPIYYEADNNLWSLDVVSGTTARLTNFPAVRFSRQFSVSPSEDRIAYIDAKDGQIDVWSATLRGDDPVQLTDDPAEDRYPYWHPDGRRIVYVSNRGEVFQICLAYLDRGRPVQVTVGRDDHRVSDVAGDGTRMLDLTTGANAGIFATSRLPGGAQSEVTSGLGLKVWPEVSPDGRMVAYQSTNAPGKIENSAIAVLSPTGGQQVQVTSDSFNKSWSPDSSQLAFIRFTNGQYSIFSVKTVGGDAKQLTSPGVIRSPYSLLPLNKRGRDISWSPDGSEIAYCSRKSGAANLWTARSDGSGETQISNNSDSNLNVYCPIWSPDGRTIVCTAETRYARANGRKLRTLWVAKDGRLESILDQETLLRPVGWSTGDELIVAVTEQDQGSLSALSKIRLLAFGPEHRQRDIHSLESAYISTVELSPDGLTLCFVSAQDGADNIWVLPVSGGEAKKATSNVDPKLYLGYPAWSPDGNTIYYGKQTGTESIVMIENFR